MFTALVTGVTDVTGFWRGGMGVSLGVLVLLLLLLLVLSSTTDY